MRHLYKTKGTCSQWIGVEIDGDTLMRTEFFGGCDGNLKAIAKLVQGMKIEEISRQLKGNTCGSKPTSCADQLVLALEEAKALEAAGGSETGTALDEVWGKEEQ